MVVEGGRGERRVLKHVAEEGINVVLVASECYRVKADLIGRFIVIFVVVTLKRKKRYDDVR